MNSLFSLCPATWQTDLSSTPEYQAGNAAGWLARSEKHASTNFPLSGRLYLAKSGWLLLSVPNALVRGVFDAMTAPGAELPLAGTMNVPNVAADVLNAHISVMTADEVEKIGPAKINERGHHFGYSLGQVHEIDAKDTAGVSKVWAIQVSSPALSALRKSYGLSPLPKDQPFHITVAVRRTHVLGNNEVSKFDTASGRGELKAAAEHKPELPWRERVEVFTKHPRTGKIYGGVWDNDKSFAAPGGGIDPGETPEQAAVRELAEETGIEAANPVLLPFPPVDNPWSDEYRASKGRNFAGSRTHFVLADFVRKHKNKNLDFWAANDRKFYRPEQALELMKNKTLPSVGEARMRALQHIIANANKKTAAADPETSILISGHSGAGKSTLSKALAEKLHLPLHQIDKHPAFVDFFSKHKNGEETVVGSPEFAAFQKLRRQASDDVLNQVSGPAIVEGAQLAALSPEELAKYKHRVYVHTPLSQLLKQRLERQRSRRVARGEEWNEEIAARKNQIGRDIYNAQNKLMRDYSHVPGTVRYNTRKTNIDDIIKQLNLKTAADLLPGGCGDNKPDSDFSSKELREGAEHEHEHTSNDQVAKEIAKDHLSEDPDYYEKQKALEKDAESEVLKELHAAKAHSDAKRYSHKADILRRLMATAPQDWEIDDPKPKYKGITHKPTKFKFHAPPQIIPPSVKAANSVYGAQLKNMFTTREPFQYDYNKPVFENIRNHMAKLKQRGDWILQARRNEQIYRATLDPKYRHQLALQAFHGTMPEPDYVDQLVERYGDNLLGFNFT